MNRPLRIAYIDHSGEMGGAEHLLLSLLRQLPSGEIIPFLFCGQEGRFADEARALGVQTQIVNLPKFYSTSWVFGNQKVLNPFAVLWNGVSLLFAAWRLVQKIKYLKIDVFQTNTIPSHIYGGIAARILKTPCVWYFHDLVEPRRLAGMFALFWRIMARILPDKIVADSQAVLVHLSSNPFGKVIHPGVGDAMQVEREKIIPLCTRLDLPADSILVGSLGRIAHVKGLDILIDSARLVVSGHQNVHFVIFGGALFGEAGYKTKLEKKVIQSGLTNNWHWMGYDEFAKEYLREVDFVVFPSRREAFGLTLVEAGYSGKAVISTTVGGIPEIIESGKTGILVPPENHKQLASAIIELVNKPQYAVSLGANAKDRVKKFFNEKRYIDEFLKFYGTINN